MTGSCKGPIASNSNQDLCGQKRFLNFRDPENKIKGFLQIEIFFLVVYYPTRQIGMFARANFVDIYLQGMRDRSMRSGTELAREIKLTDLSMARNLSNRSSGVQIPRDICTRLKRYLYSAKCSWIIK